MYLSVWVFNNYLHNNKVSNNSIVEYKESNTGKIVKSYIKPNNKVNKKVDKYFTLV